MGYPIVYETKIVSLSDGRLIHFDLSGCNNDDCGRDRDEFTGKLYSRDEFIKHAEHFKDGNNPSKESNGFDMKIRSRFCTMYDYGEHLLRMEKRSIPFDTFKSTVTLYGTVYDGVELHEEGKESIKLTPKEWDNIYYDFLYGKRNGEAYRLTHRIYTEDEIIKALENDEWVSFYIG